MDADSLARILARNRDHEARARAEGPTRLRAELARLGVAFKALPAWASLSKQVTHVPLVAYAPKSSPDPCFGMPSVNHRRLVSREAMHLAHDVLVHLLVRRGFAYIDRPRFQYEANVIPVGPDFSEVADSSHEKLNDIFHLRADLSALGLDPDARALPEGIRLTLLT